MKLLCRDFAAFVTPHPDLVPEDGLELLPGNSAGRVQGLDTGFEVEIDENLTEVEQ